MTRHARQNMRTTIIGTHALLYTSEPDAVRANFRDVFGWKHVDDGQGWLIFALPPAELGIHPGEGPTFDSGIRHQVTFMCDDITTTIAFPGGLDVMLYQPPPRDGDLTRAATRR